VKHAEAIGRDQDGARACDRAGEVGDEHLGGERRERASGELHDERVDQSHEAGNLSANGVEVNLDPFGARGKMRRDRSPEDNP